MNDKQRAFRRFQQRRQRDRESRAQDRAAERAQKMLLVQDAGFLEPETPDEKTYKVTQEALRGSLDAQTQAAQFRLELPSLGPYAIDYSPNGRQLLIGGRLGHVAAFDWREGRLQCELQLGETVRAVRWLHNETLFAAAQARYTFIYDQTGAELHRLKAHSDVYALDYLRYHFLLVSAGAAGVLRYQDTSTGALVAEHRTKLGACRVLRHNPHNAVVHLGHQNGTVTLWAPNMGAPLVKLLCHRGPVTALAVDAAGTYMATAGLDGQVKVWDLRTLTSPHSYYTRIPASSLDISQRGLLAVGWGAHATVWKDALATKQQSPYMAELLPRTRLEQLRFAPFEDILAAGHDHGISTLVIPGAGEPNYDAYELNPYQTAKQRREREVKQLLEKLPADMISLDPDHVGRVRRPAAESELASRQLASHANAEQRRRSDVLGRAAGDDLGEAPDAAPTQDAGKTAAVREKRRKQRANRRLVSRQANVIDEKRERQRARMLREREERVAAKRDAAASRASAPFDPLSRFTSGSR